VFSFIVSHEIPRVKVEQLSMTYRLRRKICTNSWTRRLVLTVKQGNSQSGSRGIFRFLEKAKGFHELARSFKQKNCWYVHVSLWAFASRYVWSILPFSQRLVGWWWTVSSQSSVLRFADCTFTADVWATRTVLEIVRAAKLQERTVLDTQQATVTVGRRRRRA